MIYIKKQKIKIKRKTKSSDFEIVKTQARSNLIIRTKSISMEIIDKNRFRTIFSVQNLEKSICYDLERLFGFLQFSLFKSNRKKSG